MSPGPPSAVAARRDQSSCADVSVASIRSCPRARLVLCNSIATHVSLRSFHVSFSPKSGRHLLKESSSCACPPQLRARLVMFQPLPVGIFTRQRAPPEQIMKEGNEATAPEPQKKRKGFSLELTTTAKKQPPTLPLVRNLELQQYTPNPPTAGVSKRLGSARLILGIDTETAGWEYERDAKGDIGQFGHYAFNSLEKLREGRMLQLGWALARIDASFKEIVIEKRSERMVYPHGFTISPGATAVHKIDQAQAEREGEPLERVLTDFMDVVRVVVERGGRIVAHNLNFDATIIYNELANCGLERYQAEWSKAAKAGCCTMDPEIGKYLRTCFGQDTGQERNTMSLKGLVRTLLPGSAPLLEKHHTAGADAELCMRLYVEICKIARTSEGGAGGVGG